MGAAYRTGTISVSNGSRTVTGSGTQFMANVSAGMMLVHDLRVIGEIDQVVSNTEPQLVDQYQGTSISDDPYAIYNLGQVRAAPRNAVAQLAWQDASEFKRNSPTILALAGGVRPRAG